MLTLTLKEARECAGLTKKDASKLIGISERTLTRYEKGHTFPTLATVKRIEDTYGVSYREITF